MPQIQLPIFPSNSTLITPELAFEEHEERVWYFRGHQPVFSHLVESLNSFRHFTGERTHLLLLFVPSCLRERKTSWKTRSTSPHPST